MESRSPLSVTTSPMKAIELSLTQEDILAILDAATLLGQIDRKKYHPKHPIHLVQDHTIYIELANILLAEAKKKQSAIIPNEWGNLLNSLLHPVSDIAHKEKIEVSRLRKITVLSIKTAYHRLLSDKHMLDTLYKLAPDDTLVNSPNFDDQLLGCDSRAQFTLETIKKIKKFDDAINETERELILNTLFTTLHITQLAKFCYEKLSVNGKKKAMLSYNKIADILILIENFLPPGPSMHRVKWITFKAAFDPNITGARGQQAKLIEEGLALLKQVNQGNVIPQEGDLNYFRELTNTKIQLLYQNAVEAISGRQVLHDVAFNAIQAIISLQDDCLATDDPYDGKLNPFSENLVRLTTKLNEHIERRLKTPTREIINQVFGLAAQVNQLILQCNKLVIFNPSDQTHYQGRINLFNEAVEKLKAIKAAQERELIQAKKTLKLLEKKNKEYQANFEQILKKLHDDKQEKIQRRTTPSIPTPQKSEASTPPDEGVADSSITDTAPQTEPVVLSVAEQARDFFSTHPYTDYEAFIATVDTADKAECTLYAGDYHILANQDSKALELFKLAYNLATKAQPKPQELIDSIVFSLDVLNSALECKLKTTLAYLQQLEDNRHNHILNLGYQCIQMRSKESQTTFYQMTKALQAIEAFKIGEQRFIEIGEEKRERNLPVSNESIERRRVKETADETENLLNESNKLMNQMTQSDTKARQQHGLFKATKSQPSKIKKSTAKSKRRPKK